MKGSIQPLGLVILLIICLLVAMLINTLPILETERKILYAVLVCLFGIFIIFVIDYFWER